jgi:hypothetical protein
MDEKLNSIIEAYNDVIKGIEKEAKLSTDRAYGGIIRAGKGKLVESIAKELIKISWEELGRSLKDLHFVNNKIKIPINKEYIEKIKNEEVKQYIKENINEFYYLLKTDIHVFIKEEFKIAVECKAYTENAMLKKILVDFTLLKSLYPNLSFVLFQLESQLGGDYSSDKKIKFGSPSTHTLLSYFDVEINIITLLKGERKVDQPIHKEKFYKPLEKDALEESIKIFKNLLVK